jgi:hypothetical protein
MAPELDDQGFDSATNRGDEGEAEVAGVLARLWTRRPVSGRQIEVIDRLSSLASKSGLDDFDVQTWPDKVVCSEHTQRSDVVQTYETVRTWADEHDREIEPPFERRTVTSLVGRTEEILTLPVLCLTVYEDGDLRGVFPSRDSDRTCEIIDFLDALESTGDLDAVDAVPPTE